MLSEVDILQVEKILGFNFTQSQKRYLQNECGYEDINESLMSDEQISYYKSRGEDVTRRLCGKTTAYIVKMFFDRSDDINFTTKIVMELADMRENYHQRAFFASYAKDIYGKLEGNGLRIAEWKRNTKRK